ncbi:heme oxygenase-like protein [Fibrisoma limi BUZ 3]|uniref:Heme oxygenase-like protein n=1 Tax=Fibrisoma limi BUZ 3 TaxID=1185876 RepID=I2GC01_9BACT|nr:biliverdin-producing heme oxygenase [Fibrisoma limi]CCH51425.1 heme oxygenase-like protein [Fibrisoma limi BUZ 3]
MKTLLERLRDETRLQHEQTEQLLYTSELRGGTLSAEQYVHLLLTHLAFHQALEGAISEYPDFFEPYEPQKRRKTPWLLADLTTLGVPLPTTTPVFAGWSPEDLLGAAYVGEGSMLGGKTVWHYLQQNPALQPLLVQARFYRGYGAETGPNWRAFGQFAMERGAGLEDRVVAAAGRAFTTYQQLFRQRQPEANRYALS